MAQGIGSMTTLVHFVEEPGFPGVGVDAECRKMGWPLTTEAQMGSYVLAEQADGRPIPEEPHKGCRDDGIDAARYAVCWAHRALGFGDKEAPKVRPAPGTYEYNLEQERRAVLGESLAPERTEWPSVRGSLTNNR
jgi:hypothetical protein